MRPNLPGHASGTSVRGTLWLSCCVTSSCHVHVRAQMQLCPAAGNFFGIVLYDALYRLAALVGPAHHVLLKPFPALLFRWDCLVRSITFTQASSTSPVT